ETPSRFGLLFAHDLFRKTGAHPASSAGWAFSGSCAGCGLPQLTAPVVASRPDSVRQLSQHLFSGRPVDAAVGDALPIGQRNAGDNVLAASDQVALDHDADDAPIAVCYLAGDVSCDARLVLRHLAAVGVAGIDHDTRSNARAMKLGCRGIDACRIKVR